MIKKGYGVLECNCTILNGSVINFCNYHFSNQPIKNDPLDLYLNSTKENVEENEKK